MHIATENVLWLTEMTLCLCVCVLCELFAMKFNKMQTNITNTASLVRHSAAAPRSRCFAESN